MIIGCEYGQRASIYRLTPAFLRDTPVGRPPFLREADIYRMMYRFYLTKSFGMIQ